MERLLRQSDIIKLFIETAPIPMSEEQKEAFESGLVDMLKDIPAVEPKQGEWLEKEVAEPIDGAYPVEEWQSARCSVCGKYHTTPYMYYFTKYEYCPHCGARMTDKDIDVPYKIASGNEQDGSM